MNLKYIWSAVILFFAVAQMSYAQTNITGIVTDSESGEPMSMTTVFLPEQQKGTLTNENGEFSFSDLPKGEVKIQFSYIGYKTVLKTIKAENYDEKLAIALEPISFKSEEVVVSGGSYSTQHQNAIKIESVPISQISSQGTPTFMEALSYVPGVDMIARGTGVSKPVIRGLSMTNVIALNNGVKLENFQFSEDHPFLVDEFGVDRIEVIKGPASLLYGSDAVGGVVNIISENPAPANTIQGDYSAQYHSNTVGVVTNLGVKGSGDKFFWGIRGGIKTHKDYKDGNGDYVPNTRFNESVLKLNVGTSTSFGLFRLYYDYNRPKLGMCNGKSISLADSDERKNNYWYQDLTSHIISTRNTLFPGRYKIDLNASYQMNNRKLQTSEATLAFEMVDMDMNTFAYEAKVHFPTSDNSEYIAGFQGAAKTNRNNEAPNHVIPNADVNDFSLFGLAQHTFAEKLTAQAGARYDFRSISTVAETNKEAIDKDLSDWSASLGATYTCNKNVLFRANLASAFRAPNLAELTENGTHGTRYEIGNADLNSQRNYEADLSSHLHFDKIVVDISGFYNRINDYIFLAPTGETNSGYDVYEYEQTDAKLYGFEFNVDYQPVEWFTVNVNYGYLVGKQDNDDYLPFIPQNKLKTEMKFNAKDFSFVKNPFLKLGGTFAAKQDNPSPFETETDNYTVFNAGVGANFKCANQLLEFSIQANNLFNETYIDHLSNLKGVSTGYYNIGRNICFSLKVPFGIK